MVNYRDYRAVDEEAFPQPNKLKTTKYSSISGLEVNDRGLCCIPYVHSTVHTTDYDDILQTIMTSIQIRDTEHILSSGFYDKIVTNITAPNALCNLANVMNSLVVCDFNSAVF